MEKGIISKERVKEHGEVFTPDKIVNDMLDLVDENLPKEDLHKYILTTYLEPSCGNGNFLLRILDRKLNAVQKLDRSLWELGLVQALSSIYGVDIQRDNVEASKARMKKLITAGYVELLDLPNAETQPFHFEKFVLSEQLEKVVDYILDCNIQWGNTLNSKKTDNPNGEDLTVIEYNWEGDKVKRRVVWFKELVNDMINTVKEYDTVNYLNLERENDSSLDDEPYTDF